MTLGSDKEVEPRVPRRPLNPVPKDHPQTSGNDALTLGHQNCALAFAKPNAIQLDLRSSCKPLSAMEKSVNNGVHHFGKQAVQYERKNKMAPNCRGQAQPCGPELDLQCIFSHTKIIPLRIIWGVLHFSVQSIFLNLIYAQR